MKLLKQKASSMGRNLYHHGIKGQKWGVRNGPPYPLKESAYSSAEKKAKSSGNNSVSKSDLNGIARTKSFVSSKSGQTTSGLLDNDAVVTSLSTLAFSGLYVASMYGISKLSQKVVENYMRKLETEKLGERNKNKMIKNFESCPKLSRKMSASESIKITNPDYPSDGTTMNCTYCTTALALREKGYDVIVKTKTYGPLAKVTAPSVFAVTSDKKCYGVTPMMYDLDPAKMKRFK